MSQYLIPAVMWVLLILFFLGLPSPAGPDSALASEGEHKKRRIDTSIRKADVVLMCCITLFFGCLDFYRLGNKVSVESFARAGGLTEYTLSQEETVSEIALFTGVGTGTYRFEASTDGENYIPVATFTQNAGDVLRWIYIRPDLPFRAQTIRMAETGDAFLGEAAFLDPDGNLLSFRSTNPVFSDEQDRFCPSYSFLNSTYFDEIYHVRTAWEHLNNVYPYEISHPPLGKLILSLGILIFGMTPFGWRFSGTFFGVLMLPVMYVFVKKFLGSRHAAVCATLVFATDFMHFVQTRLATIDTYVVFFILLMYLFMALFVSSGKKRFLALCGISFGFGVACKWTGIYAGAGLAVIWCAYWVAHRKEGFPAFARNALFCVVFFLLIPALIYYFSYFPYARALGIRGFFNSSYLHIVLENQRSMFWYHSQLVAEHPYSSVWYQWVLNIRPILYYLEFFSDGTRSSFGAFLNPALCWGGLLALFVVFFYAVYDLDWKAALIIVGYLAQLVPWMFVKRVIFEYHYFPSSLFLVLALAYVFCRMEDDPRHFKWYVYSFTGLSAVLFILFFPVFSGVPVDGQLATRALKWLPIWPF